MTLAYLRETETMANDLEPAKAGCKKLIRNVFFILHC